MEDSNRPLLATLGGSPLPLVLSIAALRPPCVRLVVGVAGKQQIADLVQTGAENVLGLDAPHFEETVFLTDPGDPKDICDQVGKVENLDGYDLDYTGGTKAMSVATYEAWSKAAGQGVAWHASERDDELISDVNPNAHIPLGSGLANAFAIDILAKMHGHLSAAGNAVSTQPNFGFTAEYVAWLVQQFAPANAASPSATLFNVTLTTAVNQTLNLDVVHLRGGRVFALGVLNSDLTHPVRKRHLFQVVRRAEQLGGQGSRAALVSPINHHEVSRLENEVSGELSFRLVVAGPELNGLVAATQPGRVTAFGTDDLAANGAAANGTSRLAQWLKD